MRVHREGATELESPVTRTVPSTGLRITRGLGHASQYRQQQKLWHPSDVVLLAFHDETWPSDFAIQPVVQIKSHVSYLLPSVACQHDCPAI